MDYPYTVVDVLKQDGHGCSPALLPPATPCTVPTYSRCVLTVTRGRGEQTRGHTIRLHNIPLVEYTSIMLQCEDGPDLCV